jgi:DNA-binding XRE family transcriptional regulator
MAATEIGRQRFRGDRLAAARKALKAKTGDKQGSQSWLARTIGAHPTSISDWERGATEPTPGYIVAICAIPELELTFADLFGTDDVPENEAA